ncbi:MAG: DUF3857 domain-containing protein [Deltaproteobacteria bacterium]|nr:DUF3857 domain-containing protein [Deltaproteobacteria bacterium]
MYCLLTALVMTQNPALDEERRAARDTALRSNDPLSALGSLARALELAEHEAAPNAPGALLELVARDARAPLAKDEASYRLLERAVRAGDLVEARRLAARLGFVSTARVIGPFPNVGGAAFGTPHPVSDLASTARVPGIDRDVGWQTVHADPLGELDLVPALTPTRETRALYVVVVRARVTQAAALRVGSSGQVRAQLNGVEVVRADVDRPLRFDQSAAGVRLEAGDNLLVVEAGFLGNDASVMLRFTRPEGGALGGLEFSAAPERIRRARALVAKRRPAPAIEDPVVPAAGPGASATRVVALAAGAALERVRAAGDRRSRPRALERWLGELVELQDQAGASASARASARVALAEPVCERDRNACRAIIEEALAIDPTSVEALLALSSAREAADDLEEARALLARARAAAPTDDVVINRELRLARGPEALGSAIEALRRAEAVPSEKNLALAADVAEQGGDNARALRLAVRARDAGRVARLRVDAAWIDLASADGRARALAERVDVARQLLALRPGSHTMAEAFAMALVAADRRDDAKAVAAERIARYPERAEPLELAAKLALIAGDRELARGRLRAAASLVPQDADLRRTLRALGTGEEPLATRYGLDDEALRRLAREAPDADGARIGAHVAASTVAMRFFENGLGRVLVERVIRIHDPRKAAGLQSWSFPYSEGREEIEVLAAERIASDGRREPALRVTDQGPAGKHDGVYTDVAHKVVTFPPLAAGDTLHFVLRKELVGRQNLFGDFFGAVEPIAGTLPTREWRLVVECPRTRALAWGGKGAPQPKVREEILEGDEVRVHDFRVAAVAPVEPEPLMPPFLEVADFVSVSSYARWQELGAWYEALVAPQLVLDDALKAVAREVTKGARDERERVRLLYEHVVTSTRYVGIELGIHGWKPYPVTEVYRRKYGDCKDKASLLVALLREAGIAANLALVRTANLGDIVDEPPSMLLFNHAIAYVPSLDLFLDGTAEQSGAFELPPLDQGALALVVGAHGAARESRLTRIPVQPADANRNLSDYVLTLLPDGTLAVRGTERFRGQANAGERRDFADAAKRKETLQRHLARILPGAQVTKLEISDLALGAEELGYAFEATLPHRAVVEPDGSLTMQLSLYPHDLTGSYADRSTRKTDVWVEYPWRTRNVMRYVLPPGYGIADLPSGGVVDDAALAFTQTITRTADGFIVDEDTMVRARRVPVSLFPRFRAAAIAADALMKRRVRLTRDASRSGP